MSPEQNMSSESWTERDPEQRLEVRNSGGGVGISELCAAMSAILKDPESLARAKQEAEEHQ